MSISTFSVTLINLNDKLKKLFIYDMFYFLLKKGNYTVYIMKPSRRYRHMMKGKWRNSKRQIKLMLNEDCLSSNMKSFVYNNNYKKQNSFVSF